MKSETESKKKERRISLLKLNKMMEKKLKEKHRNKKDVKRK
jgi:hypothetical protein